MDEKNIIEMTKPKVKRSTTNIDICVDEPIATPSVMSCRIDNHMHDNGPAKKQQKHES